jgi:glyceraldehyde-3-phosphate dehydrogenase type I
MIQIAINGFGRIGRNFLRAVMQDKTAEKQLDIAVINIGPANPESVAHMFKYDSIMGTFLGSVEMDSSSLVVNGKPIKIIAECDPSKIDWRSYKIDWVVESSGHFTKREQAQLHLDAGAPYVLITAPANDEDVAIIPGVNEEKFDPKTDHIVSLGSCTTNAFIPTLKVLHDAFGIERGFMTSIHAYTNSQVLLDVDDSDLRRSRAAALNIIPTTTGASKMLDKVMPELKGKVAAVAIRVPIAKVSIIDLTFSTKKPMTPETINNQFLKAASSNMAGILSVSMEPLVSSDYAGSPFSVTIDGELTKTVGSTMGQVFGWYDNEWGYSMRVMDFLLYASKK